MNNKGQALIMFIIILPLIILLLGMVIELSLISYQKNKLISITKSIITSSIEEKEKDDIIKLYHKNGIDDDINVDTSDGMEIYFESKIPSFLGKMIGKNEYPIKIDIKGIKKDGKVKFEKGSLL